MEKVIKTLMDKLVEFENRPLYNLGEVPLVESPTGFSGQTEQRSLVRRLELRGTTNTAFFVVTREGVKVVTL